MKNSIILGMIIGSIVGSLILYNILPNSEHDYFNDVDYEQFVTIRETMFQRWIAEKQTVENIQDRQSQEEEITVLRNAYNAGCVFALTYCNVTHK